MKNSTITRLSVFKSSIIKDSSFTLFISRFKYVLKNFLISFFISSAEKIFLYYICFCVVLRILFYAFLRKNFLAFIAEVIGKGFSVK